VSRWSGTFCGIFLMGSRDQGLPLEAEGRSGGLEGRFSKVRGQVRVQMVLVARGRF
jgi:hypothetical protein